MTLTDTQLVLLSSASQREDHLVTLPDRLKGGAAKAVVSKLLKNDLVAEIAVGRDDPHWRKDVNDRPIGLKLTRAGLDAIGVDPDEKGADVEPEKEPAAKMPRKRATSTSAPRDGSKRALLISLLQRHNGASLDDLMQATDWLPHTTRAALTGLRHNGYELTRDKGEDGKSVYRIVKAPESPNVAATAAAEA
jgi:hypothetical protein